VCYKLSIFEFLGQNWDIEPDDGVFRKSPKNVTKGKAA